MKQILTGCKLDQPIYRYPFLLMKKALVYEHQQQCNNMNLPIELYPEREICEYGYQFNFRENVTLEREGMIIYTAKGVIELAEHIGRIPS